LDLPSDARREFLDSIFNDYDARKNKNSFDLIEKQKNHKKFIKKLKNLKKFKDFLQAEKK
jgi:hypothetical protein